MSTQSLILPQKNKLYSLIVPENTQKTLNIVLYQAKDLKNYIMYDVEKHYTLPMTARRFSYLAYKNRKRNYVRDYVVTESKVQRTPQEIENILLSRRLKAANVAKANLAKANAIQGFSACFERFQSIPGKFGHAVINNDNKTAKELELEERDILRKLNIMLRSINLTLRDLEPRYHCEKCKDTGEVYPYKCECYRELEKPF